MPEKVEIVVEAKDKASSVLKNVKTGMGGLGKEFLQATGLAMGMAGGMKILIDRFKAVVGGAIAEERVISRLNAVLKSTQGVAGMTSEALNDLSIVTSKLTGIDEDLIRQAETVLLTFTKIGKDVFPDAITAATDMSEVMGQDLQSSIVQLGKALNDPIVGVTALQRVGVSFTQSQKDQIKTLVESGKTLEAQNMILAELQTEFGGAAEAAGKTFAGSLLKAKNATNELAEMQVNKALPAVQQLIDAYTELAIAQYDQKSGQEALKKAVAAGVVTQEEAIDALERFDITGLGTADAIDWLRQQYEEFNESLKAADDDHRAVIKSLQGMEAATIDETIALSGYQFALQGATKAQDYLESSAANLIVIQKEQEANANVLALAIGSLTGEYNGASAAASLLGEGLKAISEDMIEQERIKLVLKIATEELTAAEIEGLLNQQTALENLQQLNLALSEGTITKYDWIKAISDGIVTQQEMNNLLGEAVGPLALIETGLLKSGSAAEWSQKKVYEFGEEVAQLDGKSAEVTVNVRFVEFGQNPVIYGGQLEFEGQHGGTFIVPPGYPNDNFRMGVSSGELVNVTPANQVTNNFNMSVHSNAPVDQTIANFKVLEALAR